LGEMNPQRTVEQPGLFFEDRLIAGDASEVMGRIPDGSVDLVVADPPYNLHKSYGRNRQKKSWEEYESFTRRWLTEAVRLMRPEASLYVFMGVGFIARLFLLLQKDFGLHFNSWIVWHYTQGMGRRKGFSPRHEDILYFTKSREFTFNLDSVRIPQKYYRKRNNMEGANPGDVWFFSHIHYCSAERESHPTQKPEALLERIVKASSHAGQTVLDPFVGSGTTVRVARVLHRRYIGIDINPDYIRMAEERLHRPFRGFDSVDDRSKRRPLNMLLHH
jgi:DNA modification methylase